MLAKGHRQAAEDIEKTVIPLQSAPYAARVVIEGAWGAAFHWIAYGCATKHQKLQDSHTRLGRFLRHLGEEEVAEWWEDLERSRQGGWYGNNADPTTAQYVLKVLEYIHAWALS